MAGEDEGLSEPTVITIVALCAVVACNIGLLIVMLVRPNLFKCIKVDNTNIKTDIDEDHVYVEEDQALLTPEA